MNRIITCNNFQEFCRICLNSLSSKVEISSRSVQTTTTIGEGFNIYLVPNLAKLLVLFTSLDINENEDDSYPRSLCQLCYDKILDFEKFRNLALQSAKMLREIANSMQIQYNSGEGTNDEKPIRIDSNMGNNDDNHLILSNPSVTTLMLQKPIKTEIMDIEDSCLQNNIVQDTNDNNCVKHEIDSEHEENNSTFYENNALGTNYDSIGDDADDEEFALRNGAVNTSSEGLNSSANTSRHRLNGVAQRKKRDRTKKSLKCPRCDKQVYKQVYLDAHIRAVHEGHDKPFLCVNCQKAFTRYNQLHIHIQSNHLRQEKFVCGYNGCEESFKFRNTLETHRTVVHTSEDIPLSVGLQKALEIHQAQLMREIELDYICEHCSKKYSSKRALREHLKRHSQIKEFKCDVCGVEKVTRKELQTHMRIHEPNSEKFKCSICPQEFNHKNAISRHVRVVHEGQQRFLCSYCPKRFGTRYSQMCHERLHTGEKPFNCELCNKGFAQSEGLKSHMKSHDKNLRKFVCTFCSLRFITRKNLIDHEERHRGNKPHICNLCNRGFYKPEELTAHHEIHNTEMDGRSNLSTLDQVECSELGRFANNEGSSDSQNHIFGL